MRQLDWLPPPADWRGSLRGLNSSPGEIWPQAVVLANTRIDFVQTNALDSLVRSRHGANSPSGLGTNPVRLAVFGSSTLAHLLPSIRIAGLRRGLWISIWENEYGQYRQALADPPPDLRAFAPTAVLIALDAHELTRSVHAGFSQVEADAALAEVKSSIEQCWRLARDAFGCAVLHQTALDVLPAALGQNEQRLPGSRRRFLARLNEDLRAMAEAHGVDLVALDDMVSSGDGVSAWHDPALWHRSKQEVSPVAAPSYGELVGRLLAARQGRSAKCLVLDLDNTLWGGVIGDDGLDGIEIGQGSALGEGFAALQAYAKELSRRGVILAVCSKNDEARAFEPFDRHPEMILRRQDIASFRANWDDKPGNLRAIARDLNIGLDALVFLDDNPFERNLVRQELPMVAVPEWDGEPAGAPGLIARAGYFESVGLTDDDRARNAQYQQNRAREVFASETTDLGAYLRGLDMRMVWSRFDSVSLQRVVQLINKTNQFNLTTRRHGEAEVRAVMDDPAALGLQMRLLDRFGDNGIVAIVIGRLHGDALDIDTWLMSCRVLGRQMEAATLFLLTSQAAEMGATRLIGHYSPTAKNGMVRDHYATLGFRRISEGVDGATVWELEIDRFALAPEAIEIVDATTLTGITA